MPCNQHYTWCDTCLFPIHYKPSDVLCDKCQAAKATLRAGETNKCRGCFRKVALEVKTLMDELG